MFHSYKKQAEINRTKVIKKEVKRFKKIAIEKFKENIKAGKDVTYVKYLNFNGFEKEILIATLIELQIKYKNIDCSLGKWGYCDSYTQIIMKAK